MNQQTIDVILNQVIGAVIGSFVSFVISWYFYKKADFPTRALSSMTDNILVMLVQDRLGINLDYVELMSAEQKPRDTDKPHITHYYYSSKQVFQGDECYFLFRVSDTGFNFTGNLEVLEESSRLIFPVKRQGHGYYYCCVHISENAVPAIHTITIKLIDNAKKTHSHSIRVQVDARPTV